MIFFSSPQAADELKDGQAWVRLGFKIQNPEYRYASEHISAYIFFYIIMHPFWELLFLVSAKFHRLFDVNKWLLLPDTSIIDQYYNVRHLRKIPDIQVN